MINNITADGTGLLEHEPELLEFTPEECNREYWRVFGNNTESDMEMETQD